MQDKKKEAKVQKTPRGDGKKAEVEEEIVEKTDVTAVVQSRAEPSPARPTTADTTASPRSKWMKFSIN